MSIFPNISQFPKLEEWFEGMSSLSSNDPKVIFLREIAQSFSQSPAELGLRHWMRQLAVFIDRSKGDPQVFLDFEEQCHRLDVDFMKLACDVAEFAIRIDALKVGYCRCGPWFGVASILDAATPRVRAFERYTLRWMALRRLASAGQILPPALRWDVVLRLA